MNEIAFPVSDCAGGSPRRTQAWPRSSSVVLDRRPVEIVGIELNQGRESRDKHRFPDLTPPSRRRGAASPSRRRQPQPTLPVPLLRVSPGPRRTRAGARRNAPDCPTVTAQTAARISRLSGVSSPSGSGITAGAPAGNSTGSRYAAEPECERTRHSRPRALMSVPTASSPRVERYSTSPSGNRSMRIGVVGMHPPYSLRRPPHVAPV